MWSNVVYRIQIGPADRRRLGSIWLDFPHDDLDDLLLPIDASFSSKGSLELKNEFSIGILVRMYSSVFGKLF